MSPVPCGFFFQRHRVSIPSEECQRRVPRRSLAFFVHPDDDTVIECLDGFYFSQRVLTGFQWS
mgnify:CR=1 FL=1